MDSLVNYDSDGENDSNNSADAKMSNVERNYNRNKQASDANYDPVQMDMSEDSNNNNSSEESESEEGTQSPQSSRSLSSSKLDPPRHRSPPSDQRRSDYDSHKSSYQGDSKKPDRSDRGDRSDKSDRRRNSEEKCRRPSNDDKRSRDSEHRDSRRSRDDDRRHRDDDRKKDKNSSSGRDDRREDRDRKDKDRRHGSDRTRPRDRDRRHFRSERPKDRHRQEKSSHSKDKDRARSRSRSKDRTPSSFRPTYREDKGRTKLAQLEKLGIEIKAPEGAMTVPTFSKEQNFYNPLTTATAGKYAEQIQKRKLLWASKSKQDESKNTPVVGSNTWVGTTFTHDEDGKMTAKFKRLMGIKNEVPAAPAPGQKPDILKKQEEMFSNMEQQYEVARATTHTQRGVGLGYASSAFPFPR